MVNEITSRNLGGTTEITCIMPIRQGFIPVGDTRTYATRLRYVLQAFDELRRASYEKRLVRAFTDSVAKLQTVNYFRWAIIDNDSRLVLAVTFDRPWEPYIRKIARDAGPFLDVILCNCEGYEKYSTDLGYTKFREWVEKYQVPVEFFYSASPFSTVDDLRYWDRLDEIRRGADKMDAFDKDTTMLHTGPPVEETNQAARDRPVDAMQQGLAALTALDRLREFFPHPIKGKPGDPGVKDHIFLQHAVRALLHDFDTSKLPAETRSAYARQLNWFEQEIPLPTPAVTPRPVPAPAEIQGNILTGYGNTTHGCLLLLRFSDPVREAKAAHDFINKLDVTTDGKTPKIMINVAFTYDGLKHMNVPKAERMNFPKDFRDGMEARAGMLGDIRINNPENWELPIRNWPLGGHANEKIHLSTVDMVICLQTTNTGSAGDHEFTSKHPLYNKVKKIADDPGVILLSVQPLRRYPDESGQVLGHFGFVDGISQPSPRDGTPPQDKVPLGELLTGHINQRGDPPPPENELFDNGSFLALRKLYQGTAALNEAMDKFLQQHGQVITRDELKAKLMGRKPDGTPLVTHNGPNGFDFSSDPDGDKCPFQSHIRRSNPRPTPGKQAPVPRIMRRGFSYGPPDNGSSPGDDRGLFFMAYNASLAEQFEVIQRWVSGGNSTGVSSAQHDPFLGVPEYDGKNRVLRFLHNDQPYSFDMGARPFTRLKWGMYLFAPSIKGLKKLADCLITKPAQDRELAYEGEKIIKRLSKLHVKEAKTQWKTLLEQNIGDKAEITMAVWAAIREFHDGVLRTPYAVLVASHGKVMKVFEDAKTYSVREGWRRMQKSIKGTILGMDPNPQKIHKSANRKLKNRDKKYRSQVKKGRYQEEAIIGNPAVNAVSEQSAFNISYTETKQWLVERMKGQPKKYTANLAELCSYTLSKLSTECFGLPDGEHMVSAPVEIPGGKAACPFHFLAPSRYVFPPNPEKYLEVLAGKHGDVLIKAAGEFVADVRQNPANPKGTVIGKLFKSNKGSDDDYMTRNIVGLIHGFVAATFGNFLYMMGGLIRDKNLWRYQQNLILCRPSTGVDYKLAKQVLEYPLTASMQMLPVPAMLNRIAVKPVKLGTERIKAGDHIVLGVLSAANERLSEGKIEWDVIFGGRYGGKSIHACPGQPMAYGFILGVFTAIMESGNLRDTGLPVTLEIEEF